MQEDPHCFGCYGVVNSVVQLPYVLPCDSDNVGVSESVRLNERCWDVSGNECWVVIYRFYQLTVGIRRENAAVEEKAEQAYRVDGGVDGSQVQDLEHGAVVHDHDVGQPNESCEILTCPVAMKGVYIAG